MLKHPRAISWKIIYITLASLFLVLTGGALWFLSYEVNLIRENKYSEIRAIARLKSDEIVGWLGERFSDADYFSTSEELKAIIRMAGNGTADSILQKEFNRVFYRMRKNHHYADITVIDAGGHILYSFDGSPQKPDPGLLSISSSVRKSHKIILNDFSLSEDGRFIHLDIAAPVHIDNSNEAILIFTIDPSTFLYPLVQSWPAPNKTAETLLLRKEGDSVLYLNQLKFAPRAALKLKQKLTDNSLPPVQAVDGKIENFEGTDYAGRKVIADIRTIKGTPWLMVAKIDKSEIFYELKFRIILQVVGFVMFLLFISFMAAFLYSHRQKSIYEQLFLREQEFRLAQEEFRITLYSIGDAVITTDRDGIVCHMNMASEKLTGWKESEATGRPFEDVFKIILDKANGIVDNPVQRVLQVGLFTDHLNSRILVAKDGTEIPVTESGAIVYDQQNRISGVVLVFHDITTRREAEEQIRKLNAELEDRVEERTEQLKITNKELEAFTYSVSHDLRTPLRAIDGFSAMLEHDYNSTLDEEGRRLIHIVRQNAQKMGILIDELLTFSRLGRAGMNKTVIDMKEMASSVLEELTSAVHGKKLEIMLEDIPPVKGDRGMLKQVWINLISNALKFSNEKEVIKISISSSEESGRIIYCVKDNGAGFDMKYYEKLFGVFQRLHTEKEFEGTGVGLAIVQQVISRHGGTIWAEGKINQGATFCFSLPD